MPIIVRIILITILLALSFNLGRLYQINTFIKELRKELIKTKETYHKELYKIINVKVSKIKEDK